MQRFFLVFLVAGITSVSFAADEEGKFERRKDVRSMQGKWQLVEKESSFATDDVIMEYLPQYKDDIKVIGIEGNRLLVGSKRQPLVMATDLRLQGTEVRVKEGNHLICFTLEDGSAMLGSYRLEGDKLEIRVPETCECTRTGIIATFARIKD